MEWFEALCSNYLNTANTVLLYALVIAIGVLLGKIKICGISLGVTWVLFAGILAGHLGLQVEPNTLHFIREFGLILFVFCIGLQVGPSFFSSFKHGGITLNMLAFGVVLLNIAVTLAIYFIDGDIELPMMIGVLYGAVTNTPGLGAADQVLNQLNYNGAPISLGYACAYPLGVVGIILSMIIIRYVYRINLQKESELSSQENDKEHPSIIKLEIDNDELDGKHLVEVSHIFNHRFVCSRICHQGEVSMANAETVLHNGDYVMIVCKEEDVEDLTRFIGKETNYDFDNVESPMVSRRILVTRSDINGKSLKDLHLSSSYNVTITRINRSGIDLLADPHLKLQIGDRVMTVGKKDSVEQVAKLLGNELKRLDSPNIVTIFVGIFFGILLGSIPLKFPGMPTPVKLGLAGGPLIVAILIGCFGHRLKLVTYTTMSANLMLREIGITLFLASVGIDAGDSFMQTILEGDGLLYILYGVIITMVPILIIAIIGRSIFKINYYSLIGLISGSNTNPAALAFASQTADNDKPAVAYSTVYPLTMFLRIISGQLILLMLM